MAQAVVGEQAVADQGLDKLAVREALVEVWLFVASLVLQLALVYNVLRRGGVAHDDAEMPRGVVPRLHRHVSDEVDSGLVERLENLLHIPDGAVLPLALGTVLNRDLRVFVHAANVEVAVFFAAVTCAPKPPTLAANGYGGLCIGTPPVRLTKSC